MCIITKRAGREECSLPAFRYTELGNLNLLFLIHNGLWLFAEQMPDNSAYFISHHVHSEIVRMAAVNGAVKPHIIRK